MKKNRLYLVLFLLVGTCLSAREVQDPAKMKLKAAEISQEEKKEYEKITAIDPNLKGVLEDTLEISKAVREGIEAKIFKLGANGEQLALFVSSFLTNVIEIILHVVKLIENPSDRVNKLMRCMAYTDEELREMTKTGKGGRGKDAQMCKNLGCKTASACSIQLLAELKNLAKPFVDNILGKISDEQAIEPGLILTAEQVLNNIIDKVQEYGDPQATAEASQVKQWVLKAIKASPVIAKSLILVLDFVSQFIDFAALVTNPKYLQTLPPKDAQETEKKLKEADVFTDEKSIKELDDLLSDSDWMDDLFEAGKKPKAASKA